MIDQRRPAEVTASFRERLAGALTPYGFVAKASGATLVRSVRALRGQHGARSHRVELSSSHRNAPGYVVCRAALTYTDADVRRLDRAWSAGGPLAYGAFGDLEIPEDIADRESADALLARITASLRFFAWLDDEKRVARDVGRRYMPGFFAPRRVVPYLAARLGPKAAQTYAARLLAGRPELWPAFHAATLGTKDEPGVTPDQGTELARALATWAPSADLVAPEGTAACGDLRAANLRCFFGRLLRARGEPTAAARLRDVGDDAIRTLGRASERPEQPLVEDDKLARLAVKVATGVDRAPRMPKPKPLYFQYFTLHRPW
ncbi:MAG: hypothetical protein IPF92_27075 [Myxococcales bacterium]|jgi:hypothetical protein|nr:hypothetical protein [Myxococcales bacterium]